MFTRNQGEKNYRTFISAIFLLRRPRFFVECLGA